MMENIEVLIAMGASTVGRQQRVVLSPLRYDMLQVLTPQSTTRTSRSEASQFHLSSGVIPYNPPPPAVNAVNAAPLPPVFNGQNPIPYVPPDGITPAGVSPNDGDYPIEWATDWVEQNALINN